MGAGLDEFALAADSPVLRAARPGGPGGSSILLQGVIVAV
ncbi:Hypothetical protein NGAL_HAMBI1145_53090 [Neorhizobium galegae bv. officinalis]|uniref:Uncharacterized protein n=1 Tax=Neorhizobium galegae bv. officinalis TaxID=323656 RepID=A0A0T7FZA1_NEOGA|nr:Hypothetical protein NGAL_HAMBI1145_53090 [Neorhizobium galegae bv. officinalis]